MLGYLTIRLSGHNAATRCNVALVSIDLDLDDLAARYVDNKKTVLIGLTDDSHSDYPHIGRVDKNPGLDASAPVWINLGSDSILDIIYRSNNH